MSASPAPTSFSQVCDKAANEKVDSKDAANLMRVLIAKRPKHDIDTSENPKK